MEKINYNSFNTNKIMNTGTKTYAEYNYVKKTPSGKISMQYRTKFISTIDTLYGRYELK